MGVYQRDDSPFHWMVIERRGKPPLRQSTKIPKSGGSPADDKALRAAAEHVYSITKAKHVLGQVEPEKPIISFHDFAGWYETTIIPRHRGFTRERSMLKGLRAAFPFESLAMFDDNTVLDWMAESVKLLKKAPGTVNRELDLLKAMLRRAVPKYLAVYPLGDVRRLRVPEAEPRVLTLEEEGKLLAGANPGETALLITAIDTLMRLSSCVFLKWPQVKAHDIVPLNAKIKHDAVPITRRVKEAFAQLERDGDYVFSFLHTGKGTTAAKNAAIRMFEKLCRKAGLPHGRDEDGLTFHCLRHTGATRALAKGYSIRTVMKLGGWRDERMVIRYTHTTDADVRAAAESISGRPLPFTSHARGKK